MFIREQGFPVPELENAPLVNPLMGWYIRAYNQISYSRNLGFTAGPVPLTEYKAFAETFGIPESFEKFVHIMQSIDALYLSDLHKEAEEVTDNG